MIPRYEQKEITRIWSDTNKLQLWQKTEFAVLEARANLGQIPQEIYARIKGDLNYYPIDMGYWKILEEKFKHDLNAFVEERRRFLPAGLKPYLHEGMTSYDTEEPAFARMLKESTDLVMREYCINLNSTLRGKAIKHRFTIMIGKTHGQGAELQTFGKRCLTWFRNLETDLENLERTAKNLRYSKLSGAIGNYGDINPEIEKKALAILGFEPYYGATQIMPRELYAPIAQALCQFVLTLDKIAVDIRLGARSGNPIYQEPFGKKQTGSSAMPHKKNTISTEQIEGMARLAKGYFLVITENIVTWEERAIEQSSVERIAWPDLFHVVIHSLRTMDKVLSGLVVYPDNMLREIVDSRGCYASGNAKEVLKKMGVDFGFTTNDAYRAVQLSAFNAFEPKGYEERKLREGQIESFVEADELLQKFQQISRPTPISIQQILSKGELRTSPQLEATEGDVKRWNRVLKEIFQDPKNLEKWNRIFIPSYILRNERGLFRKVFG